MILTDYYKLDRVVKSDEKLSIRFDCVHSTGEYPPFEEIKARSRINCFFVYHTESPCKFNRKVRSIAPMAIINGQNISSVFICNACKRIGYGDCNGTTDALIFVFSEDGWSLEIFVARGRKDDSRSLCDLVTDGELDEEMAILRELARNRSYEK